MEINLCRSTVDLIPNRNMLLLQNKYSGILNKAVFEEDTFCAKY